MTPYGLVVTEEHVYWTNARDRTLNRFRKTDNTDREEVLSDLTDIGHITIVHKEELATRGKS